VGAYAAAPSSCPRADGAHGVKRVGGGGAQRIAVAGAQRIAVAGAQRSAVSAARRSPSQAPTATFAPTTTRAPSALLSQAPSALLSQAPSALPSQAGAPPREEQLQYARSVLFGLGAVDANGLPTQRGRQLGSLPLHPRLAHRDLRCALAHFVLAIFSPGTTSSLFRFLSSSPTLIPSPRRSTWCMLRPQSPNQPRGTPNYLGSSFDGVSGRSVRAPRPPNRCVATSGGALPLPCPSCSVPHPAFLLVLRPG
jgi:hypothetical protein